MTSRRFDDGLGKNAANFAPLTPLTLIERAASVYPTRTSLIHGERRFTWAETYARCRRLSSALTQRGIGPNDTVAVMLANTPEMYEAHFGVPMTGAVLNTLNTRLDAATLAFMLDHGEAKVLITDREFSTTIEHALARVARRPIVIDVDDPECAGQDQPGQRLGETDYEAFLATGDPAFRWTLPSDEWNAISLNYTSGTTGNPKGVVYHHRGAFLNAVSLCFHAHVHEGAVFLWTVPMFHCNGWCMPWGMAAVAGTNICLRRVDGEHVLALIKEHRVTHYGGAPIVHTTILNANPGTVTWPITALIAGAAPPRATIEGMERMGLSIAHVYGLTETYGPATICAVQPEWAALDVVARSERLGRQGVRFLAEEGLTVMDPETMTPVPADGETMGEVMFRGNITMKGYLKNPRATEDAFAGGWFHSGDLAVVHPDGYIKVKDRSKDIIISGGENISSLEVEDVLHRHPAVLLAAVVAQPDPTWGESPCAFVELKPGVETTEAAIIEHCRAGLAHFKAPRRVVFGPLPKTSTGKIQKYVLRERVKSASAIE